MGRRRLWPRCGRAPIKGARHPQTRDKIGRSPDALAMSSRPSSSAPSLLGLELLRFACAISVLVWHYNHFYVAGQAHVGFELRAQPLYGLLQPFYEAGWLGVQVFWALSGFIFFWKYARPVQAGEVRAWRFAVLRFSRLYPLHLLTLLAVAAMAWAHRQAHGVDYVYAFNDWPHFVLQLFLASDWPGRSEWSFNGPIWSVSIEVLVYGLFFGLCRLGLTRWWQVLGIIALAGAVYASKRTDHPLVLCVFFFYLGALTHLAHEALGRLKPALQGALQVGAVGLLAAGTALTAQGLLRPMFYTALLAPLAMILLLRWVQPGPGRLTSLITTLGHTTYASYLLHFPLQLLVALWSGGQPGRLPLAEPWWLLAYLGLTFGLAVGVYRWVEVPAQAALRARLLPRSAR